AVNPGNSGGALVNARGELIGINTMISSMTGSYVGYSFAVPSNITRKIVEDILEFGNVQRGILGIEGSELNSLASKELGIDESTGLHSGKVTKNSGAEKAALNKGDIIVRLDNRPISTYTDLANVINTKRPNDQVQVTVIRNGKTMTVPVVLSKNELLTTEFKGIELSDLTSADKKRFKVSHGVKINNVSNERLRQYADELEGGIILSVGKVKATDVETISRILSQIDEQQTVQIELITKTGQHVRLII